jgi:3',5'-cyclic AMP phosphodiesterase CpdA
MNEARGDRYRLMTLRLLHLSDLHFGGRADIQVMEGLEAELPYLPADAIIVSGDLCQRARHGEFQRARAFLATAAKTAPVYVLPGNHDVSWWWRPLGLLGRGLLYRNYRRYVGTELTPTLTLPDKALITGVLTADGAAWGSWSWRVRDTVAKGHLPKAEYLRVRRLFAEASPALARVLVVHHNVVRGEVSGVRGLAHARRAVRRIVASGADVVLCGHDHQEAAHVLEGRVIVSTAGTLSARVRGGKPASFNLVTVEATRLTITFYRWDVESERFWASEPVVFARPIRRASEWVA